MPRDPTPPIVPLVVDGRPVAPVVVAWSRRARRRGLLGRTSVDGALWLPRTRSVHTVGMRMTIDAAVLAADGTVVHLARMPPGRVLLPRRGGRIVVEAAAGALEGWGVEIGCRMHLG